MPVSRKDKGFGSTRGRVGDAIEIRPWSTGITADHPLCRKCTWVHRGGKFALKFVNRACRIHGKLA
jgi:hypothetical protein